MISKTWQTHTHMYKQNLYTKKPIYKKEAKWNIHDKTNIMHIEPSVEAIYKKIWTQKVLGEVNGCESWIGECG